MVQTAQSTPSTSTQSPTYSYRSYEKETLDRSYLDYENYVWQTTTDPGFQMITKTAIEMELQSRIKGNPFDPLVELIKVAEGFFARISEGTVFIGTKRRLPASVFNVA